MAGDDENDDTVEQSSAQTDDRENDVRRPRAAPQGPVDPDPNFINAARMAELPVMQAWIDKGANVNIQEPSTGATALHFAAAMKARPAINWLAKCDGIDFLIKDKNGRLPSALAFEVADDPVIGRYLASKQAKQAQERGIDMKSFFA
ncbi:hypothetical protein GH722_04885 [Alphaproteobacteria bacterium HT1-32]|nr:hypothetical protein [Alphaproteobacteria bacterium HT1-32]